MLTLLSYICFLFSITLSWCFSFFFFNDTATTEIYTLSLHDALPIYPALLDRTRSLRSRFHGLRQVDQDHAPRRGRVRRRGRPHVAAAPEPIRRRWHVARHRL